MNPTVDYTGIAREWLLSYNAADPRGGDEDYVKSLAKTLSQVAQLTAEHERQMIVLLMEELASKEENHKSILQAGLPQILRYVGKLIGAGKHHDHRSTSARSEKP